MAMRDPSDKTLLRMEQRRFTSRCEAQIASIERADTLREVARLASSLTLPYALAADDVARDALRLLQLRAEDRARELILEQLQHFARADEQQREKQKRAIHDAWTSLTGPLGHLRTWGQSRLTALEQKDA